MLNVHAVACINSSRRASNEFSIRPKSILLVRWFIVHSCAKKPQGFTSPYVGHARANTNTIAILKNLTKYIVNFATRLVFQTHIKHRVGISNQIHYE